MDPSSLLQQQEITSSRSIEIQEKRAKPLEEALKCPRCDSMNTKFCYYNNYSLTQPRYFCKSCRRYWTKGGTLRNVPVGGGCRKNRRSTSSSSATSSRSRSATPNHHLGSHEDHGTLINYYNPNLGYGCGNLGDVENWRGNIVNNEQLGVQFDNVYYNYSNYNYNEEVISNPNSSMLDENNRVLLGLPWQINSGEVLGSSWHGLLNSALM